MSILQDALDRARTHQEAAGAQEQPQVQIGIDWASGESYTVRQEFFPTANRVSLKRQGRAFRILDRLRQGPARTWDLMMLGGAGFSSRIRELRVMKYDIRCEQDEDGATYTLTGEPPA